MMSAIPKTQVQSAERPGIVAEPLRSAAAGAGPEAAAACYQIAALADRQGDMEGTLQWLEAAATRDPGNPEYLYALGRTHSELGHVTEAEAIYWRALLQRPDHLQAWCSLGLLLKRAGQLGEAETCLRQAVTLDPSSHVAVTNLGSVLYTAGRTSEAGECFRAGVTLNPASAEAHNNLGKVMLDAGDPDAVSSFRTAIELNPRYFEAAFNLGRASLRLGLHDTCIWAFRRAREIDPGSVTSALGEADALLSAGQTSEAQNLYRSLLQLHPGLAGAKGGLATALAYEGQYTRPRGLYEQAVSDLPEDAALKVRYALFLLRSGEFGRAWQHYESRRQLDPRQYERGLDIPQWQGQSLAGRSLLVTSEQGLGDQIMFASLLPEITRDVAHCMVECDQRLSGLFERSFPGVSTVGIDSKSRDFQKVLATRLPEFPPMDYQTPIGSMARFSRHGSSDFPRHEGYVRADAERVARWAARLGGGARQLKIGISWRGGASITNKIARSLELRKLLPILKVPDTRFFSLQYGNHQSELAAVTAETGIEIPHWQDEVNDYEEMAALVMNLDLVISVCTSIVHLTGALGRPVWVLAPQVAEWRYGRAGPSMIWYPSAQIFRQEKRGAWEPVIAAVARSLRRLASARGAEAGVLS